MNDFQIKWFFDCFSPQKHRLSPCCCRLFSYTNFAAAENRFLLVHSWSIQCSTIVQIVSNCECDLKRFFSIFFLDSQVNSQMLLGSLPFFVASKDKERNVSIVKDSIYTIYISIHRTIALYRCVYIWNVVGQCWRQHEVRIWLSEFEHKGWWTTLYFCSLVIAFCTV